MPENSLKNDKMKIIPISFHEPLDVLKVGKHACALNKLAKNSYPVLDGIIVTAQAFKEFIVLSGIKEQVFLLYKAGRFDELMQLIVNHEFPQELKEEIIGACSALGDSYMLSASSIFPTDIGFFNIKREQVLEWIKKCWASIFNEQNKSLNRTNMFPAVIVQKHTEIEKSGYLYTINPVLRDKTKLIVEVTTPKKYFFVASKRDLKVLNEKEFKSVDSPLFIDEMDSLLKIGLSIESSFRKPQKLTWVFNEKFYITHARRINEDDIAYFQKLKQFNSATS